MTTQDHKISTNPFPGLRAFTAEEHHLFFGREEHIHDVLQKLKDNHFVAIVGTSGTGKSSLIRAGVLPAIGRGDLSVNSEEWIVVSTQPGGSPILNLVNALCDHPAFDGSEQARENMLKLLNSSPLGLVQSLRNIISKEKPLLLLVDQFEEVFRFAGDHKDSNVFDDFVKILTESARQKDLPIYIILTLRSDFLGDCVRFEGLPETINDGHYLVPRMNQAQIRRAITGPIDLAHGKISPRLIQQVIGDLGNSPDQLPVLQHALMRSYDIWEDEKNTGEPLDVQHFEKIGGLKHALTVHANEAFNELNNEQKHLAEKVFKCLTLKEGKNRGVRRPTTLERLAQITEASIPEILDALAPFRKNGRSFVLPDENQECDASTIMDISHESLMRGWDQLVQWVNEETESADVYQRLCAAAELCKAGKAGLWRNPELQFALDWKERQQPNKAWSKLYNDQFELGLAFLEESRQAYIAERSKIKRRRLIVRMSVAAFMVVVTILTSWALIQTNVAEEKTKEALVQSEEALNQKERAETEKEKALSASERAEQASQVALNEKSRAEQQALIAEEQKRIAEKEKVRAENAANLAMRQEKLALQQKALADQKSEEALLAKMKADSAQQAATRLRMVSLSENLAFGSTQITYDAQLAALLAVEAYDLANDNGGSVNSDALYQASRKALDDLNGESNAEYFKSNFEMYDVISEGGQLLLINNKGKLKSFNHGEVSDVAGYPEVKDAPNTAYISSGGGQVVFGMNDNTLALAVKGTEEVQYLKGHSGLIRAVGFSPDHKTILSGGRDSTLIQWIEGSKVYASKMNARIKAISYGETCYVGCENGQVMAYHPEDGTYVVSLAREIDKRVEDIVQSKKRDLIAVGYSDGVVVLMRQNKSLIKEFKEPGAVAFMELNDAQGILAVATSNKIVHIYGLNELNNSPIEIAMDRTIAGISINQQGDKLYVWCSDNSVYEFPTATDQFIEDIKAKITRELTPDEWKRYVGDDIPYKSNH